MRKLARFCDDTAVKAYELTCQIADIRNLRGGEFAHPCADGDRLYATDSRIAIVVDYARDVRACDVLADRKFADPNEFPVEKLKYMFQELRAQVRHHESECVTVDVDSAWEALRAIAVDLATHAPLQITPSGSYEGLENGRIIIPRKDADPVVIDADYFRRVLSCHCSEAMGGHDGTMKFWLPARENLGDSYDGDVGCCLYFRGQRFEMLLMAIRPNYFTEGSIKFFETIGDIRTGNILHSCGEKKPFAILRGGAK